MLLNVYYQYHLLRTKLQLYFVEFNEIFIPQSGLRTLLDMIGGAMGTWLVWKILIAPNLTHNPRFTKWRRDSQWR